MRICLRWAAIKNQEPMPVMFRNGTLDKITNDLIERYGLDFISLCSTQQEAKEILNLDKFIFPYDDTQPTANIEDVYFLEHCLSLTAKEYID